jgi:hypothetical protein
LVPADARDRRLRQPIPEAPRTIIDAIEGLNRLPLGLAAKAEYEYVKAKPLLIDRNEAIESKRVYRRIAKTFE